MLKWTERYGTHTARIRAGELVVSWENGGYRVAALGRRLKEPSGDLAAAKARACALARSILVASLAALPE